MDVMYFAWLPNSVEIEKAIQLPQFRLRNTVQHDCSQNYTGGASPLFEPVIKSELSLMSEICSAGIPRRSGAVIL